MVLYFTLNFIFCSEMYNGIGDVFNQKFTKKTNIALKYYYYLRTYKFHLQINIKKKIWKF